MIELDRVSKSYGRQGVVKDVCLRIEEGQFVVLIGPSGCGKTTTLKMINRLVEPTGGQIKINGKSIADINPVLLRRGIGYVIQQIGLFPNMTIGQNIELVPKLLKWSPQKRHERTLELLKLVDMDPGTYISRYPSELSGGQQQRIGVLRALAAQPPLILMDEPFGALDPITRDTIQNELKRIHKKLNKTIVFVTHDMDEAIKLADKIVIMRDGEIVQADTPENILEHPANDFVAEFIGKHRVTSPGDCVKVEQVMKANPVTTSGKKGVSESLSLMRSKGVDSLILVDEEDRYMGVVTIEAIGRAAKDIRSIGVLADEKAPVIPAEGDAKDAFSLLLDKRADFVTVVDSQSKVVGLVTKTSLVKALAQVVWKDEAVG